MYLQCIFKGFVHRAITIRSSEKYINGELAFLINIIENRYKEDNLRKIIEEVTLKSIRQNTKQISSECINSDQKQTISLPWIPGVSPKFSKVYIEKRDIK